MISLVACSYVATAQLPSSGPQSVNFKVVVLQDAIKMAKEQGKPIFIDSYATWCIPCKKMDSVFRDPEVAQLLNDNFVNIKANMDQPYGKEYQKKYGIVFLPTFLFLDKNGNSRIKVDRLLTKYELIAYIQSALGKISYAPPPTRVTASTTPKKTTSSKILSHTPSNTTRNPITGSTTRPPSKNAPVRTVDKKPTALPNQPKEKILHVLGKGDRAPNILYQEAYVSMQMMDESHWAIAEEYLSTQSDWSTERNMRFIFDFVRSTDSEEFRYIIDNRDAFNKLLGKENIDRSIDIIVYTRINQGIPRPDLNEAINLYSLTDSSDPVSQAYKYYVKRKIDEKDDNNMLPLLKEYLRQVEHRDPKIINLYCRYLAKSTNRKTSLLPAVDLIEDVLRKDNNEPQYLTTAAILYSKVGNRTYAIAAAKRAITYTPESELKTIAYLNDLIKKNS